MEQIREIPIDDLVASKFNPRKNFSTKDLGELAESIKQKGILEPLLVRSNDDGKGYEIIAGERRFRAAELIGLKAVPAIVRAMGDEEARETQIIENLQRQDIAPLEEAQAFQDLLKLHNSGDFAPTPAGAKQMVLDVKGLAARVSKSKEYVYHRLHLLRLDIQVRNALEDGSITAAHATELAPLKPDQQAAILNTVLLPHGNAADVSVALLRNEIRWRTKPRKEAPEISPKEKARRQREAAAQKKSAASYARQQAKDKAERDLTAQVDQKALVLLWDKLKSSKREAAIEVVDLIAGAYAQEARDLGECTLISRGKPVPEEQAYVRRDWKYLQSLPRARKLAILALTAVSEMCGQYGAEYKKRADAIFRVNGIDRKKLRAEIVKAQAASKGVLGNIRKPADAAKPIADVGKAKPKAARKRRRPAVRVHPKPAGKRKAAR
jgi:ParB family chromosome partitioning protein